MNSKIDITVAFTGHRTYKGEANAELCSTLEQLYSEGYTRFLCGMAWGWDLAAGEMVLNLKQQHPEIELIAVVPYTDFKKLFRGEDLKRYDRIINAADEVITVNEEGGNRAFILRNDYLVNNSSIIVAWWNNTPSGGTAYTVRKAQRLHRPVINLKASLQLNLF